MRISLPALVRPGETVAVQALLVPGPAGPVTRVFVVHFASDSAFVEPFARPILRQVAKYAEEHSGENLVILGHTDKTGDDAYNQSLSERRARAVHAFLTSGRDPNASLTEWKELRALRPKGELPSVKDSWGLREGQHMLQDLGFYPGPVDGKPGDLTDSAVSAFRCQAGLPPGKILDDAFWDALVDAYLKRDALAVPADRFLVNCSKDDLLKWLGAGEQDPVKNVEKAWRPNRRVELLFVRVDELPCKVPPPDTWTLVPEGAGGSDWCLGPGDPSQRSCFLFPALPEKDAKPGKDQWVRPPEGAGFTAAGSILQETRQKVGSTKLAPFAKKKFALFTPDGEILAGENSDGKAQPARTDKDGKLSFSGKRPGLYCLEVGDDVLARLAEEGDEKVRGNSVCKFLMKADDRLNVVLIDAPMLREIRLPVVAHLMTRTDPPAPTRRTGVEVRAAFEQINRIWRQARIRFDPVDVVRASYKRPDFLPSGPAVSPDEFGFLRNTASFLGVVNIFFVQDVDVPGGSPEFGFCVSFEGGVTRPGCAVADGPDPKLWVRVIAHELGHFLNLEHPEEQPGAKGSFSDRLMFGGLGLDTLLFKAEVDRARASLGARLECQPLRLIVMGAAPLGGRFSDKFIAVREAGRSVIVEATGPPALLAQGPVTWSGEGAEVPGQPFQRSVSRADVISKGIKATLAGFSREVRVIVVDFDLEVEGAKPVSSGSTTFVATREKGLEVLIRALVSPPLTIVPDDIVRWQGDALGDAGPFERTVSRSEADVELVRATVGGTTLERTIVILEAAVMDEALKTERDTVQIEGVLNGNHKSRGGKLGLADLVSDQRSSSFRVRVVFPGRPGATVQAVLASLSRTGTQIDSVSMTLSRTDGDRFASPPLLAIASVLPEIETEGLVVVRAEAGGRLRLEVAGLTAAEVRTRGRIIRLAIQAFEGVGVTVQDVRRHVHLAGEAWAQAGFEIEARSIRTSVPDPADFAHLEIDSELNRLTQKERRFLGLEAPSPARSPVVTDINVYYVNLITGDPAGSTYRNGTGVSTIDLQHAAIAVEVLSGASAVGVSARKQDMILAHELGHLLLINWGADEHHRRDDTPWPSNFLMHASLTEGADLHGSQAEHILRVVRLGQTPFVLFEPP